jgi:hypothetical protein
MLLLALILSLVSPSQAGCRTIPDTDSIKSIGQVFRHAVHGGACLRQVPEHAGLLDEPKTYGAWHEAVEPVLPSRGPKW